MRRVVPTAMDPTVALMAAAALIGAAVQIGMGRFDRVALGMAVAGTALVVLALETRAGRDRVGTEWLHHLARAVLVIHLGSLVPLALVVMEGAGPLARGVAAASAAAAAALAWDQLREAPRSAAWGRVALVAAVGLLGLVWIGAVSTPIDVFHYQDVGSRRLFDGINPYAPGYPNPYGPRGTATFFGPGLAEGDVLLFGFPYPPLSLLLALPGALAGDVRVAHLVAVVAAGWLLLTMVDDSWAARAGGVLFLTTPMLLPLVQRSWTETFVILLLVGLVWLLRRGSRADAVALGMFVAVKQYAAMFLPILLVVAPHWHTARQRWRALGIAVAVAVGVTLPLALWDFGDFLFSVVLLQFRQPFRADAMSLPAMAQRTLGWSGEAIALPGMVIAFSLAMWWTLRRASRTWLGAGTAMALLMLTFLLFNKQAFTNYYMLAVAMLWLAVTLRDDPRGRTAPTDRRQVGPVPSGSPGGPPHGPGGLT